MKIKTFARRVLSPLLAAAILLAAGSVFAQVVTAGDGRGTDQSKSCSSFPPSQIYTISQGPASPDSSQFRPDMNALIAGGSTFGHTQVNKSFGHTFKFRPLSECCVYTSGTLTVNIKALNSGAPGTSTAANDTVSHVGAGGATLGSNSPWSAPPGAVAGTLKTVTFPVTSTEITNGMVSFFVQDDTAVVSATLTLGGLTNICLSCPPNQGEVTFPGSRDKFCCTDKPGSDKFCCTKQK